jgi:hypothetical protein
MFINKSAKSVPLTARFLQYRSRSFFLLNDKSFNRLSRFEASGIEELHSTTVSVEVTQLGQSCRALAQSVSGWAHLTREGVGIILPRFCGVVGSADGFEAIINIWAVSSG